MKVTTTSSAVKTLAVPFTSRCAYCGTKIDGEEKVTASGYAFRRGYASDSQEAMMNTMSGERASANMSFELEYAEKRLEHYRSIVAGGSLKKYLETGKAEKADTFRVEQGSALEEYLKSKQNKTQGQVQADLARQTDFPYRWKIYDKETAVKCPMCGRIQPWCERVDGEKEGIKSIFMGLSVCLLGCVPFMAGAAPPVTLAARLFLIFLPVAAGITAGIIFYRAIRKKQLLRLAALPWNVDDLPRFDEEFLSRARNIDKHTL